MARTKAEILGEIPLFRGLSKADLDILSANVDEVAIEGGTDLITEGQINHSFYVIQEGEVEVTVGGQHRRDLGRGEFFGEISMDGLTEATAGVRSKTRIRVFVVSHSQFRAMRGNSTVLAHIRAAVAERLESDKGAQRD